jgi:hypothetical protein
MRKAFVVGVRHGLPDGRRAVPAGVQGRVGGVTNTTTSLFFQFLTPTRAVIKLTWNDFITRKDVGLHVFLLSFFPCACAALAGLLCSWLHACTCFEFLHRTVQQSLDSAQLSFQSALLLSCTLGATRACC